MIQRRALLVSTIAFSCGLAACSPSGSGGGPPGNGAGGSSFQGAGGDNQGAGGDNQGAGGDSVIVLSTGGGSSEIAPGDACGTGAFKGKLLPSNILFVVDRSGSMNCNLPPTTGSAECEAHPVAAKPGDPTKWSVISQAMSDTIDKLAALPNTYVGLTFFSNDDECGVQSTPNVPLGRLASDTAGQPSPQAGLLKSAFANVTPSGGTPLIGAVILGYKYLHQIAQAPGNRFVVLVTDGSDSCVGGNDAGIGNYASEGVTGDVTAQLLNKEIPDAIKVNIRTFVIGAPGSEPSRGLLSQIAYEGGTASSATCDHSANPAAGAACHLDMTTTSDFAKDLSTALQNITGSAALTCQFDVPTGTDGQEVDKSTLNVDYYKGGNTTDPAARTELVRDDTCAGANGWQYVDPTTQTQIQLCKSVCDQVLTDSKAQVVVEVGCPQRTPH